MIPPLGAHVARLGGWGKIRGLRLPSVRPREREREKERERGSLLTIKK
jgi:hypothetical protein